MSTTIQHNVFLQKSENGKIIMVTILDEDVFEKPELIPSQAFVMATTTANIYSGMNPAVKLDMKTIVDADYWCEQQTGSPARGLGISGIITSPVWFCKKVKNFMNDLLG